MKKIAALAAASLCAACAYTSEPVSSPALNVYSSYTDKMPGNYLLFIEADEFDKELRFRGFECSAHRYPVSLESGFRGSITRTFENLAENVQVVDRAPSRDELSALNADAVIIIRGDELSGRMTHHSGFFRSKGEAMIEIQASMTVDGPEGRLLGTSVEGDGDDIVQLGMMCGGAEQAVTVATENALEETMERLGEAFTNSQRVRETVEARRGGTTGLEAISF